MATIAVETIMRIAFLLSFGFNSLILAGCSGGSNTIDAHESPTVAAMITTSSANNHATPSRQSNIVVPIAKASADINGTWSCAKPDGAVSHSVIKISDQRLTDVSNGMELPITSGFGIMVVLEDSASTNDRTTARNISQVARPGTFSVLVQDPGKRPSAAMDLVMNDPDTLLLNTYFAAGVADKNTMTCIRVTS